MPKTPPHTQYDVAQQQMKTHNFQTVLSLETRKVTQYLSCAHNLHVHNLLISLSHHTLDSAAVN